MVAVVAVVAVVAAVAMKEVGVVGVVVGPQLLHMMLVHPGAFQVAQAPRYLSMCLGSRPRLQSIGC